MLKGKFDCGGASLVGYETEHPERPPNIASVTMAYGQAYGQLPLYHKNSKVVLSGTTKSRWKEYYLLVVTLFGFLMLYAGVLWFVPSVEVDDGYGKAYSSFTGPGASDGSAISSEPRLAGKHSNSGSSPFPGIAQIEANVNNLRHGLEKGLPSRESLEVVPAKAQLSPSPSHHSNASIHSNVSAVNHYAGSPHTNRPGNNSAVASRRNKIVEVSAW